MTFTLLANIWIQGFSEQMGGVARGSEINSNKLKV